MGAAWLPGWLWRSEQHWPHILCSSAVHQLALSLALSCSAHSVTTGRRPRRCPPCLSPPCMGILKLAGYFHNGQLNQTMQERTKGLGGPAASTSPAVAYSQWSGYFRVDILVFGLAWMGEGACVPLSLLPANSDHLCALSFPSGGAGPQLISWAARPARCLAAMRAPKSGLARDCGCGRLRA